MRWKERLAAWKVQAEALVARHPNLALLQRAAKEFRDDDAPRLSAALAYYGIFSLAPILLLLVAAVGLFFGEAAASGQLARALRGSVGPEGAEVVEDMVAAAAERERGVVAAVSGTLALLAGATAVFAQLQSFLNIAWDIEEPKVGWKGKLKDRAVGLLIVLVIGVLLTASLAAGALLGAFATHVADLLPGGAWVWRALHALLSAGVATVAFAALFRYLPDATIAWRDALRGAFATAALFVLGQVVLGAYLGQSAVVSAYGAAGSVVAVLLWVYYSSLIFFFGAELTQVYANARGRGIRPERGARHAHRKPSHPARAA